MQSASKERRSKIEQDVRDVISFCASWYDLPYDEFLFFNKIRHVYRYRKIAIWLAKNLTDAGPAMIGRVFGYSDHTAILRTLAIVDAEMRQCPDYRKEILEIRDKFLD